MHCRRYLPQSLSRRQMLSRCAGGFGAVALAALMSERAYGAERSGNTDASAFAPRLPQYRPRAKNVIFLFMEGGVSQVDSFDPKPRLTQEHGQPFKMKVAPTAFNAAGSALGSPWKFTNYGKSGLPVSDLFPHIGQCVDELCVIRSMTSEFSEHAAANYFLHTGSGQQGRPSMGAWASYGLGSACRDLPGFIVLNSGKMPLGGPDNFGSAFLPATHQGSIVRGGASPVSNIRPLEPSAQIQSSKLALMRRLDHRVEERLGKPDQMDAAIANYEMAFRMQSAVPEVMALSGESAAIRALYGLDSTNAMTAAYAENCLRARRLVERGVRFVEVTVPNYPAEFDTWDAHNNLLANHNANALACDQPIAGLIRDLKSRGMLDETLVVFASEFGRTPFAQGTVGRDHNPLGFTVWMAGGGVRVGTAYGSTDEYGYRATENKADVYDLHATMLHLLGVDHKQLTYRWGGRDMRLTDVHGEVMTGVIA